MSVLLLLKQNRKTWTMKIRKRIFNDYRVKNYKYLINDQENSGKQETNGKAKKSAGRMPWHWEPTKDVINCDKLRGVVSTH